LEVAKSLGGASAKKTDRKVNGETNQGRLKMNETKTEQPGPLGPRDRRPFRA